ncbi:hypothetical protein [Mucilaginibacter polytrichastri]|uniref:GH26 domain-containing protein n=1 Tax=Mucilaginibacter polytrichastri TaxID=1302689 RepID=A0A1Q5ZXA9_9SPHI|nr:hypothetical protein [Mucilaginibacter polytrichastri]OKS86389.1 hypothetical protein RG47T_1845 [Mucilaginibacter polytrichastri]
MSTPANSDDANSTNTETTSVTTAPTPDGLPKRVAFGTNGDVSNSDKFIQEADYQYQYLAGDIFSNGWTTWTSPSGEFARTFLTKVSQMGKVPVFTYYNIVPAKNRYEDPGFTNLNDAEVMNKYFDDFKFLLQICKNFGKPVIIHYEPDLFGYMEMYKNNAAKSTIKVSQSNQADVQGFTNDAKGLAQAIVSMRNKYAPNVILGWHASHWATGADLIIGKRNPEQVAIETAAYYKSLNAPFDLIFSEFTDRDEGYTQLVTKTTTSMWSTMANANNGDLSDFDRFQRFLKKLNTETGRKIILWQIPVGNTLTQTCNNTDGHYKDNIAEYFLKPVLDNGTLTKITQYGQAGVIAFLFGQGISSCTSYMDTKNDGLTGGANETSDDDGGYLRKAVKAYYQTGPVLAN